MARSSRRESSWLLHVLCVATVFDAQVVILEHKSIICAGYNCVLHIHSAVEEVRFKGLIALVDRKTVSLCVPSLAERGSTRLHGFSPWWIRVR